MDTDETYLVPPPFPDGRQPLPDPTNSARREKGLIIAGKTTPLFVEAKPRPSTVRPLGKQFVDAVSPFEHGLGENAGSDRTARLLIRRWAAARIILLGDPGQCREMAKGRHDNTQIYARERERLEWGGGGRVSEIRLKSTRMSWAASLAASYTTPISNVL